MNFEKFERNLVDVIKESQIKLGYESMSFGINYVTSSLLHLIDTNEGDLQQALLTFADEKQDLFGKIDIKKTDIGYYVEVSPKGVDYVHNLIRDDEFLVKFINQIRNPLGTIDQLIAVFKSYSDKVCVKEVEGGEFDYLIYFEDGTPDEFWYCIDTEDLGITYHRFMKDDYLDFGF